MYQGAIEDFDIQLASQLSAHLIVRGLIILEINRKSGKIINFYLLFVNIKAILETVMF